MTLQYTYLGHLNIDTNTLPIKAVVSRLDPKLWQEREKLLAFSPRSFLITDVCNTPKLNLENCFIYIAMITDNTYPSCKDDLDREFEATQSKELYRIFFRVSNKVEFSISDILIRFDWKQVMLLFQKVARWLLFWSYNRQFPEDHIRAQVSDHAFHNTEQNELASKVREAFEQCRGDMCVALWVKINIPYSHFWNNVNQQLKLRKQIARDNGNEPECVWLVKEIVPLENLPEYLPILVLLPDKDLDKFIPQSKSKPDQKTTNQLSHTPKKYILYYVSHVVYPVYQYSERMVKITRGFSELAEGMMMVAFSLSANVRELNRDGKLNRDATGQLLLMFVCYNYLREKILKDQLEDDLQASKKLPEHKIVSSDMPSGEISEAIGKSDIFIILWGDKTHLSENVKKEFELAERKEKPIILLDGRSDTTVPLDSSMTKGYKCVLWNNAIDVEKVLREASERLLNEN